MRIMSAPSDFLKNVIHLHRGACRTVNDLFVKLPFLRGEDARFRLTKSSLNSLFRLITLEFVAQRISLYLKRRFFEIFSLKLSVSGDIVGLAGNKVEESAIQ